MAQPTTKTYLGVLAAFVVICGVGGYLAANWRSLATAYYLHRVSDPGASGEEIEAALRKATRYDRPRVMRFLEEEIATLNRHAGPPAAAAPHLVTLTAQKSVLDYGELLKITVIIANPTDAELELPVAPTAHLMGEYIHYPWPVWKNARRDAAPQGVPLGLGLRMWRGIPAPSRLEPHGSYERASLLGGEKWPDLGDFPWAEGPELWSPPGTRELPAGFYRVRFHWQWPRTRGGPKSSTKWLAFCVLPELSSSAGSSKAGAGDAGSSETTR